MTIVSIVALAVIFTIAMYGLNRKRYEVLALAVDTRNGNHICKSQKFRTRYEAEQCYAEHCGEFSTMCIIER